MKYLCLGYRDEKAWEVLSDGDRKALIEECIAYDEHLRSNGHSIDRQALQRIPTAITLRFENGRVVVRDGPAAETNEPLSGVIVLEATDLNHAIQLMSGLPCMRPGGSLEIRPVAKELFSQRRPS